MRVTLFGVPIIRAIVFGGLYWGTPILGNYHLLEVTVSICLYYSNNCLSPAKKDLNIPVAAGLESVDRNKTNMRN